MATLTLIKFKSFTVIPNKIVFLFSQSKYFSYKVQQITASKNDLKASQLQQCVFLA